MRKRTFSLCIFAFCIIGLSFYSERAIGSKATFIGRKHIWNNYPVGEIFFKDKAPQSNGSRIYHSIIKDPQQYIRKQALAVINTLYDSPKDSIPQVRHIFYTLENIEGISATQGGKKGDVHIFYSTRHVEKSFTANDTDKVLFETRGVLLHELTHAYQLNPQGIGTYNTNKVFWAFIEGMADAVRVANGGFKEGDRPKGGSYMNGYRYAGYFFVWIRNHKDRNFLRKFNRSTLKVIPWSFDGGVKYALGKKYQIDKLWKEYQIDVGDIKK